MPFEEISFYYCVQSCPIQMRAKILYVTNLKIDFKMLLNTNRFLDLNERDLGDSELQVIKL